MQLLPPQRLALPLKKNKTKLKSNHSNQPKTTTISTNLHATTKHQWSKAKTKQPKNNYHQTNHPNDHHRPKITTNQSSNKPKMSAVVANHGHIPPKSDHQKRQKNPNRDNRIKPPNQQLKSAMSGLRHLSSSSYYRHQNGPLQYFRSASSFQIRSRFRLIGTAMLGESRVLRGKYPQLHDLKKSNENLLSGVEFQSSNQTRGKERRGPFLKPMEAVLRTHV